MDVYLYGNVLGGENTYFRDEKSVYLHPIILAGGDTWDAFVSRSDTHTHNTGTAMCVAY